MKHVLLGTDHILHDVSSRMQVLSVHGSCALPELQVTARALQQKALPVALFAPLLLLLLRGRLQRREHMKTLT